MRGMQVLCLLLPVICLPAEHREAALCVMQSPCKWLHRVRVARSGPCLLESVGEGTVLLVLRNGEGMVPLILLDAWA